MAMINGYGQDYANATIGGDKPADIVPGGYVLRILEHELNQYKGKQKLTLYFDIAEGEFRGYYANLREWESQFGTASHRGRFDIWLPDKSGDQEMFKSNMRTLKAACTAFNESNQQKIDPERNFDTDYFNGKLVGGIFGDVEWEYQGNHGMKTRCRWLRSVQTIRDQKFEIPEPKMLSKNQSEDAFGAYTTDQAAQNIDTAAQQPYSGANGNDQQNYTARTNPPPQAAQRSYNGGGYYQQNTTSPVNQQISTPAYSQPNMAGQPIELGDLSEFEEILSDGDVPF